MPFEILYHEKALGDLESILDYIAQDSAKRANDYVHFLQKEIGILADFPRLGVNCKRKQVYNQCKILIIDDYLVFYKIDEIHQTINIARVLHCSVNYKSNKIF